MCENRELQELLPAYLEQALADDDRSAVERHLSSCADCRRELELLRMLAADTVPDPGEAFWLAMPGKVYRAVQREKALGRSWWGSRVPLGLTLPRWAWAGAACLALVAVSWLIVRPAPVRTAKHAAVPDRATIRTVVTPADLAEFADLTDTEVDAVDLWATEELALLQDDALDIIRNSADLSNDDRLTELSIEELESLSRMLDKSGEEG